MTVRGRIARQVYRRDGFRCQYCGATAAADGVKMHIDHITPRSKGGKDTIDNLRLLCAPCNQTKGAQMPTDQERRLASTRVPGAVAAAHPLAARWFCSQVFEDGVWHAEYEGQVIAVADGFAMIRHASTGDERLMEVAALTTSTARRWSFYTDRRTWAEACVDRLLRDYPNNTRAYLLGCYGYRVAA